MGEITNEQVAEWMGDCTHPNATYFPPLCTAYCPACGTQGPRSAFAPADYLHDLTAAGLVLERMRERGYEVELTARPKGLWIVYFDYFAESTWPGFFGGGDTLPEAICRAALAQAEQK